MAKLVRYNQYTTQLTKNVASPPGSIGEWQIVATGNHIGLAKSMESRKKNNPAQYVYAILSDREVKHLLADQAEREQRQRYQQYKRREEQKKEERRWRTRRSPNRKDRDE